MPSTILGNPLASGPQQLISGWPWSGQAIRPQFPTGGVQLRWISSGGNAYVGFSGGMTLTSGGMFLSGSLSGQANRGILDGMIMAPGDAYFVPQIACGLSGGLNIFAWCDAAASGNGRMWWEIF